MNINELDSYDLGDAVKFNSRLNPQLWTTDEHLRPEVRAQLLLIAEDFAQTLGLSDLQLKDITVSGSNAAYTYTPNSDLDLHLVVDLPEADASEVYRELFDAKKYQYNDTHAITIGGVPVELYVENANQKPVSQGIYSVLNNEWIDVPKRRRPAINDMSVKSKFEDLGHRIEAAIATKDFEKIDSMAKKIKQIRQAGLDQHGEFGPENLAFKVLRTQGLIKQLYDARNEARSEQLSLKERRAPHSVFRYGFRHPAEEQQEAVVEEVDEPATLTDEDILRDFVDFCVKELKVEEIPAIKLRKDPQWPVVHKTFGRYINDKKMLEVAWGQRHIMDVLRTVAHELTHRHQHERDGKQMGPDAGETGSPYENEANARAGILMRDYARLHPDYFAVGQAAGLHGDEINEDWRQNVAAGILGAGLALGGGVAQANDRQFTDFKPAEIQVLQKKSALTEKYYNELVRRAKESGRPLTRATLRVFQAQAQDAAELQLQKQTPVKSPRQFPNQGSETHRSADFDKFEEGAKEKLGALAAAACIAGTPGCASTQDVIRNTQDIGRMTIAARNLNRAGVQDELSQELRNYLRAKGGQSGEGNLSKIYQLEKGVQKESASGYIPTKKQAKDPRFSMALTQDIRPGQVGKEANKLNLKTDKQGVPQVANPNGLFERLSLELAKFKKGQADEDYSPDNPPGPETKPTMPKGTVRVDVSDMYDWYKLGKNISNLKAVDKNTFGKGPPSTIVSFGDEETEHKYINDLENVGLSTTDIDPVDPAQPKNMKRQKTDPTYNVSESADEESWELVGQPVSEIQAFVKQLGLGNNQISVDKITPVIDATPSTELPSASIPKLKNLANKPGEGAILQALQSISGQPDADKHFKQLMTKRDSAERRQRGYDVSSLISSVKTGQYESPVLLKLPTGVYVIGGRTRLYAALALGMPIRVKILTVDSFAKQAVTESTEQELNEVRMASSNLQQWARSPEAQGIRAGFEAELIFRDTVNNGDDDYDMEPDYDMDERCRSIQQIIDFFGGGDYGMSSRALDRLQEQLDETYYEWYDEQMQKDFSEEAEDLIRKILVDDGDWDLDNEIQKQLVMQDDISDDELNAIIQAGEKAPKFTSSKEQILYAEANPLYEKYLDAQEEAEGLLDDLVADEVRKQGAIWDAALDDFRDNYSLDDDSGFFDDTGLRWMSDVSNNYDAEWPYMTGGGHNDGSRDWEEISDSLNKAVDMPVKASSGYHGATRKEGLWIVEPDTSLRPDDSEDFGLEIVSPPMPLLVALNKLQEVCDWANSDEGNAYTNDSTGLHMGVSVPYKGGDVDYVKLILFLGDEYVLQQFGREANTYCASAMKKLRQNVGNSNARYAANVTNAMELMRGNLIELANREIQKGVGDSKYTSAHIQDGYIEFRSAGGDWLAEESADPEKLSSTMLRYARAMQIAADPSAERREYAKKLYKLIAPNGDDQLALFSQFTAGELNAEQLKKRWAEKAIGTEKKMNQRWKLYQNVDGRWEPVPGGEWNGYEEDQVKNAVWSKYGREALDSGEYQLVNMGEQSWEVYDVNTGKTLEIVKGKSKGEVADQVYDKYVDQGIGFQVRPYEDPATMTPRAKLAKRIVKPKEKADWDVIYKPTGRVIDNILHVDKESAQQLLKKVAVLHDFKNADDLEIRPQTAERPQSADDRQDSADLQATLQNTERGEWEFYRTETGNVIDRVNDASRMQANAVRQDIVRRYGHPDASVGMRRVDQSGVQDVAPDVAQNFTAPQAQDATDIPRNWEFVNRINGQVIHTMTNASYNQANVVQDNLESRYPDADIYLRSVSNLEEKHEIQ